MIYKQIDFILITSAIFELINFNNRPLFYNNWFNRWSKMAQKLFFMINCYHLMDSFEKVGLLTVLALWVPCGLTLPLEEIYDWMTLEMNEPKNAFRMVGLLGKEFLA